MKTAYILAAYRTAGCRAYKGKFQGVRPDDLAAAAIKGLLERTAVDAAQVEDVILGCAFPEAEQGWNLARVAAMKAGLPVEVPGMTVNRLCSSGLQAIALAAERIQAGWADCLVAGGTESMTCVPLGGNRNLPNPGMALDWPESFMNMGLTAELVAERYGVTREDQDAFAAGSHAKAAAAIAAGRFAEEIIPVEVEHAKLENGLMRRSRELIAADDGVRVDATKESLAKLKPVFKMGGSVTAGNTSQMTDGAAAALVVSEAFLKRLGRDPLARFVAFGVRGVAPEVMGIGPIAAIPATLKMAGLALGDIGLIELNEAFASQSLAVVRHLGLDPDLVNVNGGAIALGHPLGCSGAKLTATLLSEMGRAKTRYGMVSMCIGLGMGAAGIFERL
jgi:acetyl-CoA acyltransferase